MEALKQLPRQHQLIILAGLAVGGWVAWLLTGGWPAAMGLGIGTGGGLALFSRGLPFRLWLRVARVRTKNGRDGLSVLKELVTMGLMVIQLYWAVRLRPDVDLSGGQLVLMVGLVVFFTTEIGESLTERALRSEAAGGDSG